MVTDLVGTTLGQYQIIELHGRGGMASVYKAWQPALQRYVALKVLDPQLSSDANFVNRFRQEAVSAANLQHANIVTIYDVGAENGHYFIAMEFIEGTSLEERIRSQGALPPEQVVDIIAQVGRALDYAHQRGFIHRDIKPANVLIDQSDRAVLTDFGIAKAVSDSGVTAPLTKSDSIFGTPHYMSPEQIKEEPLDHRTDLYSLGIVCYEMLSGQVPFDGATTHSILYAQAHNPPPPLREMNPAVPPSIEGVVNKMLAKRPAGRYNNAGEFAAALAQAVVGARPSDIEEQTVVVDRLAPQPVAWTRDPDEETVVVGRPAPKPMARAAPAEARPPIPAPGHRHPPTRRRRWPLALLGVLALGTVLIAGAVLLAVLVLRSGESTEEKLSEARAALAAGNYAQATDGFEKILESEPENADALGGLLDVARELAQIEERDQAIAIFEKVLDRDPDNVEALKGMGEAYEAQEDCEQAVTWYERWMQVAPDDAEARVKLGWAYYKLEDFESAAAQFSRATELQPEWSEGFEGLGRSYHQLQHHERAVDALKRWKDIKPEDATADMLLADSLYILGRYDEAISVLNNWVELSPDEPNAYQKLGWTYHRLGRYDDAVPQFQRAVDLQPDSADALWGLGSSLYRLERYGEALVVYEQWREIEPENPMLYRSLGWLYFYRGSHTEAIDALRRSLDLEVNEDAYRGLEAVYKDLGQDEDSIQVNLEWITFDPESEEAYTNLGWAYYRTGSMEDAITAFQKAIQLDADQGDAFRGLGASYVGLKDHKNALAAYQIWAELEPDNPLAHRNIGWEHYLLREYEQAIDVFRHSLKLEDHFSAYLGLGSSYQRLGDCTSAISFYEKVLELKPGHAEATAGLEACR